MMKSQFQPGATILAALTVAFGVILGVVGCNAEHPTTPLAASSTGMISSSVAAQALVDVSAIWATHPLPPCPRVIVGNQTAPARLVLPSDETVAGILAGVRSPGSDAWVREKLGWVTQELAATRADIISDPGVGAEEQAKQFGQYVKHVRAELQAGHDISDPIDKTYPEGCS
ncbi:hypothetical protein [Mycobacteroides franklinii]|uniref:hypothetical protein n=1 Tax=Mycobacteroides franklinii TaxID=948102 RepID=UPI001F17DEF5|nr:hypothetical protein [Mycobacteroides franklinii]